MVRGITNFIQQSSGQLLRPHKLHNTYVIVDGKNISFQLYLQHSKGREFFGGDYDSYSRCVTTFFDALLKCQITPIVVFDGNNEEKKLPTNFDRYNKRFLAASNYSPATASSGDLSVFPLFLRTVFTEVVNKMSVLVYRCEFAADNEIANLAKELNAPILSQDSDYFIYDVLYVPFSGLMLTPQILGSSPSSEFYLNCQLYSCKYFLNAYPGLRWEHMTLIATVSGNDYIESDVFETFYSKLCKQKGRAARLKNLIQFLRNKTFETALTQIMNSLYEFDKKKLAKQIAECIIGYQYKQSVIPKALQLKNFKVDESLKTDVCGRLTALVCSALRGVYTEDNVEELNKCLQKVNLSANQVDGFLQKNQMCVYPAPVFEIAFSIMYFLPAILENFENVSVHTVSYNILSAMNKIISQTLQGKEVPLKVVGRQSNIPAVRKFELDRFKEDIVSLKDIHSLSKDDKLDILLAILNFKSDKDALLEMFKEIPSDWRLFFICVIYWKTNATSDINDDHLSSVYLSAIVLKIIDKTVGVERSVDELSSKYPEILALTDKTTSDSDKFANMFEGISKRDSVLGLRDLIPKFRYDTQYRFDKRIVHAFAELQSCIYYINSLNALLDAPLEKILVSEFYNDTFLFNVYHDFCIGKDVNMSLETLLAHSPAISEAVLHVHKLLKNIFKV